MTTTTLEQAMTQMLKARQRLNDRIEEVGELPPETPACSRCHDLGYISKSVPFGHPEFGKLFPCPDCEQGQNIIEMRNRNLLRQAGIPSKYAALTFDTFVDAVDALNSPDPWGGKRLAYSATTQFAANPPTHMVSMAQAVEAAGADWNGLDIVRPGLVISGPHGSGKTGLMAAIVNACKDQGERPLYIRLSSYLEYMQSRYGENEYPTTQDIKRQAMEAPILAIDEFFVGRPGDTATPDKTRHVEDILEYRKAQELPTVITCNQSPDEILAHWGKIVFDRVFELCHFIPMAGDPLRDTFQPITEAF